MMTGEVTFMGLLRSSWSALVLITLLGTLTPVQAARIHILPEAPEVLTFDGVDMVAVRPLCVWLDATVETTERTITVTRQRRMFRCTLQSVDAMANGRAGTLLQAPYESFGTRYIPLAPLLEALGGGVEIDDTTAVVRVTVPGMLPAVEMPRTHHEGSPRAYQESDTELFIMDIDGENMQRLTHNSIDDSSPMLSSDGTTLYFQRAGEGFYRRDINAPMGWLLLPDNPFTATYAQMSWATRSEVLLGTKTLADGTSTIFGMRADGSGQRQFTRGEMPTMSPDGRYIAFERWNEDGTSSTIGLYTVSTGDVRLLTRGANPQFSPDGSYLLFSKPYQLADNTVREMYNIYVLSGGNAGTYFAPGAGEPKEDEWSAVFSPDSQHILLLSGEQSNLYLMKFDRSDRRAITRDGAYSSPRYLPDGSGILALKICYNGTRHDIFRMGMEGTAPIRISGALSYPDIREFTVTPNGEQILFSAAPQLMER